MVQNLAFVKYKKRQDISRRLSLGGTAAQLLLTDCSSTLRLFVSNLWSLYVIGQTIIFSSCSFFLLLSSIFFFFLA